MSSSASLGGPVPLPPPGPSAALPPGAPARALHVELPSQQVRRPRAGGRRWPGEEVGWARGTEESCQEEDPASWVGGAGRSRAQTSASL